MSRNIIGVSRFLNETTRTIIQIDDKPIIKIIEGLEEMAAEGRRLYLAGNGGSASLASHFAADLNNLTNLTAINLTDNVPHYTAKVNDRGYDEAIKDVLSDFQPVAGDGLFVISVGGGSVNRHLSLNLIEAVRYARKMQMRIFALTSLGGDMEELADVCIKLPEIQENFVTSVSEGVHSLICHLIAFSPSLKVGESMW